MNNDLFLIRFANLPAQVGEQSSDAENICDFYQKEPLFQEAICLASPNLYRSLNGDLSNKQKHSTAMSLTKYLLRMSQRATPFGLFSSVGLGAFTEKTMLNFHSSDKKKRAQLSLQVFLKFRDYLTADIGCVRSLSVMLNPQLFVKKERVISYHNDGTKNYYDSIKNNEAFTALQSLAKTPLLYKDLEELLHVKFPDTDRKKTDDYLFVLFQKKYLISELNNPSFFTASLEQLQDQLGHLKDRHPAFQTLLDILADVAEYEKNSTPAKIENIRKKVKNCGIDIQDCIRVDSYYSGRSLTLSKKVRESVTKAIETVLLFSGADRKQKKREKFLQFFIEKFGMYRACTLPELLQWVDPALLEKEPPIESDPFKTSFFSQTVREIDLEQFKPPVSSEKQMSSLDIIFEVHAPSQEEVDRGNFQVYIKGINPTASTLFGRFCYLFPKEHILPLCDSAKQESDLFSPIAVVEIEIIPEKGEHANVAMGARLRLLHMPLYYHQPDETCISLEDIAIRADQNRVFAYSISLQKELHFVLGTAINPLVLPFPIRFLLFLSHYQTTPFSLLPGFLEGSAYLPRIRYRNVILATEKWHYDYSILNLSDDALFEEVHLRLKEKFDRDGIPRKFTLSLFDHTLRLDREVALHLEILVKELMKYKKVLLSEDLTNFSHLLAEGDGEKYVTEFVIPYIPEKKVRVPKRAPILPADMPCRYGNDWLFIKLFLPFDQANPFLIHHLFPLMHKLCARYDIKKWFYIRYFEEQFCFRLRIQADQSLFPQLMAILQQLLQQEVVSDFLVSPYEREVERYGGPDCIRLAEDVFHADSLLCSEILCHSGFSLPLPIIASLSAMNILGAFCSDFHSMLQLLIVEENQKHHLSGTRSYGKRALEYARQLFDKETPYPSEKELDFLRPLFSKHREVVGLYAEKVSLLEEENSLMNGKKDIINSLLHMHSNRLLGMSKEQEAKMRIFLAYLLEKLCSKQTISL